MENDYLMPMRKLKCIGLFYRTGLLPGGKDAVKNKAVEDLVLYNSPVYRRGCKPQTFNKFDCLQTVQNQPFRKYYESENLQEGTDGKHSSEDDDSSLSCLKLETLQGRKKLSATLRMRTDQYLIRRPTFALVTPLARDDELFRRFAERMEMKPKLFRTTKEQYSFYTKSFPLLLDSKKEEDKAVVPRKRTPSPEKSVHPELKREILLKTRLLEIDRAVDKLDEETDDIDFRTELRSYIFDPTRWEWNKRKPPFKIAKSRRKRRRFTTPPCFSPTRFK